MRHAVALLTLLALSCGGSQRSDSGDTPGASARDAIAFDELGGDAWSFVRRVDGSAPDRCTRVEIARGDVRLIADVERGRFTAAVPLEPGMNAITARCASGVQGEAVVRYHVRLRAAPRAVPRVALVGDELVLRSGESAPNESTRAPIVSARWESDPSNPEPLRAENGELTGDPTLVTPSRDGEYVAWLTVTDARGERDRGGVYFVVRDGRARLVDRAREHPSWIDRAIVYGVVPFLFGDPAFEAVTDRLVALADLGVTTLWLSPIYESPPDDFGYAVTDYFSVRESWGSLESFRALVDTAHRLGMRVILDFVPNHTSVHHPYFEHAARFSRRSPYYGFYERDRAGDPEHYFDWEHLPNLDFDNAEVRRFVTEAFAFWTRELDVDGFRVDVAWGVVDRAPGFFADLRAELARIEPKIFLLAEATAARDEYFTGGFDAAYDWTDQPGHWAWADAFGERRFDLDALDRALAREESFASAALVMRFLDNNDTGERFVSRHGPGVERAAAALLFTLPGIPALFTGQEIAARYHPYERESPLELDGGRAHYAMYERLARLRTQHEVLIHGELVRMDAQPASRAYAFARVSSDRAAFVAINFDDQVRDLRATIPSALASTFDGAPRERLLGSTSPRAVGGELRVTLSPFETVVATYDLPSGGVCLDRSRD